MLLLAGATAGTSDIAMNAEGVEVEQRLGRSIMSEPARHVVGRRPDRLAASAPAAAYLASARR